MEAEAAKLIGAGIAVLPLLGVGIGIGNIFSSLVNSIARNPSARNDVFGIGILGFALTEAIALSRWLLLCFCSSYSDFAARGGEMLFAPGHKTDNEEHVSKTGHVT